MEKGLFRGVCTIKGNPKWKQALRREDDLYRQPNDVRSDFARDYARILHSTAYRRLKNKTQVFFATSNDHICTRIEHVNHVTSVSDTIVKFLGLNSELACAIAIGHDVGHPPFGHHGETILNQLAAKHLQESFWHEKNGLWMLGKIETLPNPSGKEANLNLTYAVRDGVMCHCGEVDEEALFPREAALNLDSIAKASQYPPFTWEGCVVKIADKISFIGRDIEDALRLDILKAEQLEEFKNILKLNSEENAIEITNTKVIHDSIIDLCKHSNPEAGLRFSAEHFQLIKALKQFSRDNIYNHERLDIFKDYAKLIINSIAKYLIDLHDGLDILDKLNKRISIHPSLTNTFSDWLIKYSDIDLKIKKARKYENKQVYDINNKKDYIHSVITYISGMTDNYAIEVFNELISFK